MSQTTDHTRSNKQGSSRRRRSRGGKNRQQGQHENNHRHQGQSRHRSERSEEFRPKQTPRYQRETPAPKLTFWQKIRKVLGLYKAPAPQQRPPAPRRDSAKEQRAPKSNVRNARTDEPREGKPESARSPRRERSSGDRPRGGDGSTVESTRVYVGNLSYDVTEQDLQELFKGIGTVRNVEIVYNRGTHRSKGYGFVEMLRKDEAVQAVEVLHDQFFMGRKMIVSGAKSKGQDEREDKEPVVTEKVVALAPLPEDKSAAVAAAVETPVTEVVETLVTTDEENKSADA